MLSHHGRQSIKKFASLLGMESIARRLYVSANSARRRNARDDAHLALLLAFSLSEDANCIDVGAHAGDVLRQMQRLAPNGHHRAFEPLPQFATSLRAEFPQVEVCEIALSDTEGTASFVHVESEPGYSGLRDRTHGQATSELTVRTARLDDVVGGAFAPDFIKIDVEGAEHLVLAGAIETLRAHRPIIYFEHSHDVSQIYEASSSDVFDLLEGCGYRIFDVDGAGPYSRQRFAAPDKPIWNFIATP